MSSFTTGYVWPSSHTIVSLVFTKTINMKAWFATTAGALALFQLVSALWLYGKLPVTRPAPARLGTVHRVAGTLAFLISLPVAYHCLWALGLETGDGVSTRTVVHGVLGCAVFGAVVVKVVAVRSRHASGWFLPVAGGLLFALLIVVVLTSAGWYLGDQGWPGLG